MFGRPMTATRWCSRELGESPTHMAATIRLLPAGVVNCWGRLPARPRGPCSADKQASGADREGDAAANVGEFFWRHV